MRNWKNPLLEPPTTVSEPDDKTCRTCGHWICSCTETSLVIAHNRPIVAQTTWLFYNTPHSPLKFSGITISSNLPLHLNNARIGLIYLQEIKEVELKEKQTIKISPRFVYPGTDITISITNNNTTTAYLTLTALGTTKR